MYPVFTINRFGAVSITCAVVWQVMETSGTGSKEEPASDRNKIDGWNLSKGRKGEECSTNAESYYLPGHLSGETDSG